MRALNQITGAMDEIDTILNMHLKDYIQVHRHYTTYNPKEWDRLLKQVHKDFGRPSIRWSWMLDHKWQKRMMEDPEWRGIPTNEWHVIFYFKDNADAVMFGLKY
tara:strand:- start:277 stop:588 length:312 start_codon:yes stop_codon:yes gene_type:complete